ncbi:MAG: hypothetical protein R3F49_01705 [Planctomycetota bacterium]
MNRHDPDRRTLVYAFALLSGALLLAGRGEALRVSWAAERGGHVLVADTSPIGLAGRLRRASAPGSYVDVNAPLADFEVPLVVGYRDAAGRPIVATR